MGNEVGSNDLENETSLLNSSKTKEPQHARSGHRSPSTYSGPESEQNVGKTNLGSILLTCPLVMLKVSARLDLETADLPSSCKAPSVGT